MKKAAGIFTIALVFVFSTAAFAENTYDPGVNRKQRHQQKRIVQGVKSGELTKREAVRLEREQARIAKKERRFKSDGELTRRERASLHRDLTRSSRHIYKQKHD